MRTTTEITENTQNTKADETKKNTTIKLATAAVLGAFLGVGTHALASNISPDIPAEPGEAEIDPEEPAVEVQQTAQAAPQTVEHHHVETVYVHEQPEVVVVPVNNPTTTINHPTQIDGGGEPKVEFLEYGTVRLDSGREVDVISFTMDGKHGLIVDVDRDGIADSMLFDRDGNGDFLREDEMIILGPGESFPMAELRAEIDNKGLDEDLPDYTKDGGEDVAMLEEEEKASEEEETDDFTQDDVVVEQNDEDALFEEYAVAEADDNDVVAEEGNAPVNDEVAVVEETPMEEAPQDNVESFSTENIQEEYAEAPVEQQPMEDMASNDDYSVGTDATEMDVL